MKALIVCYLGWMAMLPLDAAPETSVDTPLQQIAPLLILKHPEGYYKRYMNMGSKMIFILKRDPTHRYQKGLLTYRLDGK